MRMRPLEHTTLRSKSSRILNIELKCGPAIVGHAGFQSRRFHPDNFIRKDECYAVHPCQLFLTVERATPQFRGRPGAPPWIAFSGGGSELIPSTKKSDEHSDPPPDTDQASPSYGDSDDGDSASSDAVQIDLELPRRSMLVTFTCNLCNGRTERLVNPIAWDKGLVIAQCGQCKAWHKLADAANLVQEIRYSDFENSDDE